jgi:hypothetical protein
MFELKFENNAIFFLHKRLFGLLWDRVQYLVEICRFAIFILIMKICGLAHLRLWICDSGMFREFTDLQIVDFKKKFACPSLLITWEYKGPINEPARGLIQENLALYMLKFIPEAGVQSAISNHFSQWEASVRGWRNLHNTEARKNWQNIRRQNCLTNLVYH